jgi:hypothetical protein
VLRLNLHLSCQMLPCPQNNFISTKKSQSIDLETCPNRRVKDPRHKGAGSPGLTLEWFPAVWLNLNAAPAFKETTNNT